MNASRHNVLLSSLFLVVFAIALAGCDTGDPIAGDDEPSLVGTWTLDLLSIDTYLTASAAQEIIDPNEPGEGQITVSGDLDGTLTYLRRILGLPAPFDASDKPITEVGFLKFRNDTATESALQLIVPADEPQDAAVRLGSAVYERSQGDVTAEGATLSLDAVTFTNDDGAEVTTSGSITAAMQSISAGEEVQADRFELNAPAGEFVITFNEDSTFTALRMEVIGEEVVQVESTGTWSIEGNELALETEQIDPAGGNPPFSQDLLSIRVGEGQVVVEDVENPLFNPRNVIPNSPSASIDLYEEVFGMQEGTLTDVRQRGTYQFNASENAAAAIQAVGNEEAAAWVRRLERLKQLDVR